jgi:ubiquitin carboxyl-terminal hydrolase MINDY-1/2
MSSELAQHDPTKVHPVKRITFLGHRVAIILQDRNGPCPLLAVTNAFLLLRWVKLEKHFQYVHDSWLVEKISQFIRTRNAPKNVDAELQANMKVLVDDVLRILPDLSKGMDVNTNFADVESFEFQAALSVFDLSGLRLLHGFTVDPETEPEVAHALGIIRGHSGSSLSYNAAVDLLVTADEKAMMAQSAAEALEKKKTAARKKKFGGAAEEETKASSEDHGAAALAAPLSAHQHHHRSLRSAASANSANAASHYAFSAASLELLQQARSAANSLPNAGAGAAPAEGSGEGTPALLRRESSGLAGLLGPRKPAAAAAGDADGEDGKETEEDDNSDSSSAAAAAPGSDSSSDAKPTVAASSFASSVASMPDAAVAASASSAAGAGAAATDDDLPPPTAANVAVASGMKLGGSDGSAVAGESNAPAEGAEDGDFDEAKEEAIVRKLTEEAREAQTKATIINDWLNANATQLTFSGLQQMLNRMVDTEVAVLYRNGHFSTIFRKGGQLYSLATDEGFSDLAVCWESLDLAAVTGDCQYYFEDFKPAASLADGLDYGGAGSSGHHSEATPTNQSRSQQQQRAPVPVPAPAPGGSSSSSSRPSQQPQQQQHNHGNLGFELPPDFHSMSKDEQDMMLQVLQASMAPPSPAPAASSMPVPPAPAPAPPPGVFVTNNGGGNSNGWFDAGGENLPAGVIGDASGNAHVSTLVAPGSLLAAQQQPQQPTQPLQRPSAGLPPPSQSTSSTSLYIGPSSVPAPIIAPISRGTSGTDYSGTSGTTPRAGAGTPTSSSGAPINKNDRYAQQAANLRELTMQREARIKAQTEADAEMARRMQQEMNAGVGAPPPSQQQQLRAGSGGGGGGGKQKRNSEGKDCIIM